MTPQRLEAALALRPRVRLAILPTPLEVGPELPGGARLLVKRDDLTGLGLGGNKARKLEFLCGAAREVGADTLVTVGAAQSNHARMTAAAGTVLGLDTHVVFGGDTPAVATGNQLLARLFGAQLHFAGGNSHDLYAAELERIADELERAGRRVYRIPMGGSTAIGEFGFAEAWIELMSQCAAQGVRPKAVVHASATAGMHAGLLVGRAIWQHAGIEAPDILAVGVDTLPHSGLAETTKRIGSECLAELGLDTAELADELVEVDESQIGPGYAVPTVEGDAAIDWAARHGAWVLDRTYTGKAFAGLLAAARAGRFGPEDTVVFWHTGGQPAVFAPGGSTHAAMSPAADRVLVANSLTEREVA